LSEYAQKVSFVEKCFVIIQVTVNVSSV